MPNQDDPDERSNRSASVSESWSTEGDNISEVAEDGPATVDLNVLQSRIETLERTITSENVSLPNLEDKAAIHNRLNTIESDLEDLTDRVDELEAATRAIRGYAGGIDAVNEDIERKANLALAKVEKIERVHADEELRVERLDAIPEVDETDDSHLERSADGSTGTGGSDGEPPDESNTQADDGDRSQSLAGRLRDAL